MNIEIVKEIGQCNFCEKKAEVVIFEKSFLKTTLRLFCHKCSKNYIRSKDSIRS